MSRRRKKKPIPGNRVAPSAAVTMANLAMHALACPMAAILPYADNWLLIRAAAQKPLSQADGLAIFGIAERLVSAAEAVIKDGPARPTMRAIAS